jgi:hypothetical protein
MERAAALQPITTLEIIRTPAALSATLRARIDSRHETDVVAPARSRPAVLVMPEFACASKRVARRQRQGGRLARQESLSDESISGRTRVLAGRDRDSVILVLGAHCRRRRLFFQSEQAPERPSSRLRTHRFSLTSCLRKVRFIRREARTLFLKGLCRQLVDGTVRRILKDLQTKRAVHARTQPDLRRAPAPRPAPSRR